MKIVSWYLLGFALIGVALSAYFISTQGASTAGGRDSISESEVVNTQLLNAITIQHSKELKVFEIGSSEISKEFASYNLKTTSLIINGPIDEHVQSLLEYAPYPGVFKLASVFTNPNNIKVQVIEPGVTDKDVMLYYLVLFDHREVSRHDNSFGFEIKCLDASENPVEKIEFSIFTCDKAKLLAQEIAQSVNIFDQNALDDFLDKKVAEHEKQIEEIKSKAQDSTSRN